MLPAENAAGAPSAVPTDADVVLAAARDPADDDALAITIRPPDPTDPSVFNDVMKRLEMRDGFELRYEDGVDRPDNVASMGGGSGADEPTKAMSEIGTAEADPRTAGSDELIRNYTKAVNHSIELHLIANAGSSMTQAMNKLMQSH